MRISPQPDSERSARSDDALPTCSRWRHIPEPGELFGKPKPPLLPRVAGILAGAVVCMVPAMIWCLKSDDTPPVAPGGRDVATTASNREPPEPPAHEPPAPDRITTAAVPVIDEDGHKIDEVLRLCGSNPVQDHSSTAQVLINLLPTLTRQGQVQCARHITNLLPGTDYHRVLPIWRNAASNRDVIEILGADLLNRDPKIMLPAMLDAVRQPLHPFQEMGRQTLQLFLDADYGSDFAQWESALRNFVNRRAPTTPPGGAADSASGH